MPKTLHNLGRALVRQHLLTPALSFILLSVLYWIFGPWTEQGNGGYLSGPGQWAAFGVELSLWLYGALLVSRLVALLLWDGLLSQAFDGHIPQYLRDVVSGFIFAVAAVLISIHVFQLPVSGVWATSGAIGIVLGLALRNIILDLFTGLSLNIERPFVIGDWVSIQDQGSETGLAGWVTEINWRTTRIVTRDNVLVVVPNNFFGERIISNYSRPERFARFSLHLHLDYTVPPERALRVLLAGVRGAIAQPRGPVEQPPPDVLLAGVSERGIDYLIRYWVIPTEVSEAEATNAVWGSLLHHLHHAGLKPAYPKQDVLHAPLSSHSPNPQGHLDLERLLMRTAIFAGLNEQEIHLIAETARQRTFAENGVLVREGEAGSSMFLLIEGILHVRLEARADHPPIRLAILKPGDFFGEISLLTNEPRSATVVAATDCLVCEITKDCMEHILTHRPEVGTALSMAVAERRLRLSAALANASPAQRITETGTLAEQILSKMWTYFGLGRIGNSAR
jgi:small-conductance mechanosensitive channel/CRP-like cAMP-binding protein